MHQTQTVYVIDDDVAICHALTITLNQLAYRVECFATADEFLEICAPNFRGCIITDINMPGMSGLVLQDKLNERGISLPIIFMTGYGAVDAAVQAMKKGALDFLEKPVMAEKLIARVEDALAQDQRRHKQEIVEKKLHRRIQQLTPREKEVVKRVAEGNTNKQIAKELGISYRTVEKYRAAALGKLEIANALELSEVAKLLSDSVTV